MMFGAEFLTESEHEAVNLASQLYGIINKEIIGNGASRQMDIQELTIHIHAIQNMVLAQAASRAYPKRYRLMGDELEVDSDSEGC